MNWTEKIKDFIANKLRGASSRLEQAELDKINKAALERLEQLLESHAKGPTICFPCRAGQHVRCEFAACQCACRQQRSSA